MSIPNMMRGRDIDETKHKVLAAIEVLKKISRSTGIQMPGSCLPCCASWTTRFESTFATERKEWAGITGASE